MGNLLGGHGTLFSPPSLKAKDASFMVKTLGLVGGAQQLDNKICF